MDMTNHNITDNLTDNLTDNITGDLTGYEIAVIGMAGRFPGAANTAEFWENLKNGKEGIRFFTNRELEDAGVPAELLSDPNYVKAKGMLEDVEYFDSAFFNYTQREADIMDPQLRILHESSWTALEDAGYDPESYKGRIGFYGGAATHYYWLSQVMDRAANPSEAFAAISVNDGYSVSTQLAYRLNLKGPAITLQTACSTSLVAIHSAAQALLSGECDMALAGGVGVKLPVKGGYRYQEGMVLSPDGRCRVFDAKAAGTVEGSGVGVVVLKPLENALEDNDHIYAMIKGTAVNNDGNRRVGYSAPSVIGQSEVIHTAQKAAEVEPESITYIEAHGTGTTLGDPVELRALIRAFDTDKKQYCRIGSVKSNIGHLDAAAGVAGFIKTVLALYHRTIPPTLHYETPNPGIDFPNSPFIVNTESYPWESNGQPLRAGVSAFGIGGTNAHVVLEESPEITASIPAKRPHLLTVSAATPDALERNTEKLAHYFKHGKPEQFSDEVYTLQVGRKSFRHRRMTVARNAAEAAERLAGDNSKKVLTHTLEIDHEPPVVFMFSGLGGQYRNMGRGLYENEPVFRREMDRGFEILKPLVGNGLKEILYPETTSAEATAAELRRPEISQPAIFLFEYALARQLMEWGIMPHAMIGYSFGEYAAAVISEVMTLKDALTLIFRRGEQVGQTIPGGMLSVPMTAERFLSEIQKTPAIAGEIFLAIDNGPTVIAAGTREAVDRLEQVLKQQKILSMRLDTDRAIHSPLMNPIRETFVEQVRNIQLKQPRIPYISNVTGTLITPAEATNPDYWGRHLAETVRFCDGIKELVNEPDTVFLELGPGRDISAMVRRYMGENQQVLNMVRPQHHRESDTHYLQNRLGRLWLYGKTVDWQAYYRQRNEQRRRIPMPTYSFERKSHTLGEGKPQMKPVKPLMKDTGERKQEPGNPPATDTPPHIPEHSDPPITGVEARIAEAFGRVFGQNNIGRNDDFFELGGDSLKVITLVTDLHHRLEVEVPMETVFRHTTPADLAAYIGEKAGAHIFTSIPEAEEKDYYPITPPQQRLFILDQLEEKNKAYNLPSVLWLHGDLDVKQLENACRGLLERHEALRTGFHLRDGKPMQKILTVAEAAFHLEYHDHRNTTGHNREIPDIKTVVDQFIQPYDLSNPPLWRVGLVRTEDQKYLLMQNIHHIVCDDISIGVMIAELAQLYRGESLEPLPIRFRDYAQWHEENTTAAELMEEQKKFWLERFKDAPHVPVLEMPTDYPRPEIQTFEGDHIERRLDPGITAKLEALYRDNKTTLFVMMFAIYNTMLHAYTGQEDIIVGAPITGRAHRDVQQMVGMFVNTLALRNRPSSGNTFREFLQYVKEETLKSFANQLYQFEDLVEQLDLVRDMSRNPLFDTMFVLHTVDMEKVDLPGITLAPYQLETPVSKFDMSLNTSRSQKGINLILEYNTALFKRRTMEHFMEGLLTTVTTVLENPGVTLQEIRCTVMKEQEEEKRRILYEFNNTAADYPADKTIFHLFEDQTTRTPENTALIMHITETEDNEDNEDKEDKENNEKKKKSKKGTGNEEGNEEENEAEYETENEKKGTGNKAGFRETRITYRQLHHEASRIAAQLREKGVTPGTVVAVLAERSIEMMLAIYGILSSGAAYLPIDPDSPKDRIQYQLKDSSTRHLLTTPTIAEQAAQINDDIDVITVTVPPAALRGASGGQGAAPLGTPVSLREGWNSSAPGDPAYVIYTSGSTGKPKGTIVENHSVVNRLCWMQNAYPLNETDVLIQKTPVVFDVSVWELFWWAFNGASLCLPEPGVERSPDAIVNTVHHAAVSIMHFVPSMLNMFLEHLENDENYEDIPKLKTLRQVFASGEALAVHHVERFNRQLHDTFGTRLTNLYGPTEATVDVSFFDCPVTGNFETIPIGKPIDNIQLLILDKNRQLLPFGVPGQLHIAGAGLARGYLNRPELTADKFITGTSPHYSLIYNTGDRARWLPDGNIEYLGRMDDQVKIRGFRIEPGEIETRLIQHNEITEAVVLPREEKNGDRFLCTYIVSNEELDIHRIREFLGETLPDYMIPADYIRVENIPLTPNGKADRRTLSQMKGSRLQLGSTYLPPENETEKIVVEIWKNTLNLDKVGVQDNFFDLGGTSLKIIAMANELKKKFKRNLPVATVFRYPTIRHLAGFLSREEGSEAPKRKDRADVKAKGRERLMQKRKARQ
jgi:amino acid adenylation domain-containing protein